MIVKVVRSGLKYREMTKRSGYRGCGDTMQKSRDAPPYGSLPSDSVAALLTRPAPGHTMRTVAAKETVIAQGDRAVALYYVCRGHVQLTIVSKGGKQAVVGILTSGDFFGEGCIGGQTTYHSSAVTLTASRIVRIERDAMLRLLEEQPAVLETFMRSLLSRSFRIEADLVDQLFHSTELRLARALSLLADLTGAGTSSDAVIPRISQEVLAARVGTTRSRINFLMNKFRKLGLVEYTNTSRTLKVRAALLTAIAGEPAIERSADPGLPRSREAKYLAPALPDQARRWQMRADEYHAVSEAMRTPSAKESYAHLSRTYERLAGRAERRSPAPARDREGRRGR